jgi:hypothetical protein
MGVKSRLLFSLGAHSKQAGDEGNLPHDIPRRYRTDTESAEAIRNIPFDSFPATSYNGANSKRSIWAREE